MCWAESCCFCVRMDVACVLIGIKSLIFSAIMVVSSAVFLTIDFSKGHSNHTLVLHDDYSFHTALENFELNLEKSSLRILLFSMILMGLSMMLASALLIAGISKKKPGFLLFYFSFGIFFTIYCLLAALLVLLDKHWVISMLVFVLSMIYIHFLVVVHTVYEGMLKGKTFGYAPHGMLEEDDNVSVNTAVSIA